MIMTAQEKEDLQEKILRLCNAAGRVGIREDRMLRDCQRYGFDSLLPSELAGEILIVEKAGLVTTAEKELRPDLRRWMTTADGDRWLMKEGLI